MYDPNLFNGEMAQLLEPLLVHSQDWYNTTSFRKVSRVCCNLYEWHYLVYEYYQLTYRKLKDKANFNKIESYQVIRNQ